MNESARLILLCA